jgi:broad specificity phosphatase PhoE
MRTVYFIKHGKPTIVAGVPAHEWLLSAEGRTQSLQLARQLASQVPDVVVTSEEPKAAVTGRVLAVALDRPVRRRLGLHEQLRYTQPFYGDTGVFERAMAEFFARPSEHVAGEETADQAHARFSSAVNAALQSTQGDVALVAHGTVISLLVARANDRDPVHLWKQLPFCGYYAVEWPSLRLQSEA